VPGTAPPHPASIAAAELVRAVGDGGGGKAGTPDAAAAVASAVAALEAAVQDADGGTSAF
jgi:hypothetical protein